MSTYHGPATLITADGTEYAVPSVSLHTGRDHDGRGYWGGQGFGLDADTLEQLGQADEVRIQLDDGRTGVVHVDGNVPEARSFGGHDQSPFWLRGRGAPPF